MMRLWNVTNGYRGYNYVHVLVLAPDRERALTLAQASFFAKGQPNGYTSDYWDRDELQATEIFSDLSVEQATSPED